MKNKMTPGTVHNLKILAVSDFIDQELTRQVEDRSLEPVDLIISCGDMDPEYLTFLREQLDTPLYYVKGNHDIRYTPSNPLGCQDINGRITSRKTLNILGLQGSIWYNGGQNQYTESQMGKKLFWLGFRLWRKPPVHIVVTHAPPRHIHDKEDRCHMGFECYRKFIKKHKPDYFLHGHIHAEFNRFEDRITNFNGTRVINTCGHAIFEV